MGGEVCTDFKSSNRIEISWLVQVLLNFDWFRGSTPWGVGGGWMWGVGGERVSPHMCTCMHTHAHASTHAHIWHHREFPQWGLPFAIEIIMFNVYMCVCACVHVHAHAHVWRAPPTTPTPQSHREPKTPKFNNSWTNRDNSILFEDSLPLNIPELI